MPARAILKMGSPVLRRIAQPVVDPQAPDIAELARDLRDTLAPIGSCGIAAPQIGIERRVVLYCIPEARIPAGAKTKPVPWTLMINPVLTALTAETSEIWERCLSLPGLYGRVPRFRRVGIRFQTPDGRTVEREATGFHAMLVQHECDHLDGVLYPMRMTDLGQLSFASELAPEGRTVGYRAEEFD